MDLKTISPSVRFVTDLTLKVWNSPRTCAKLSTYGCRFFYHSGPTVWNSLPDELKRILTVLMTLSTILVSNSFQPLLVWLAH